MGVPPALPSHSKPGPPRNLDERAFIAGPCFRWNAVKMRLSFRAIGAATEVINGRHIMQKFFKRILATGAMAIAISASAAAADKIDPAASVAALNGGKVRVIIVTRANTAIRDGGNALRRPAAYLSRRLGAKAQRVSAIGALPMATALVNAEALQALRDDPNVAFVVKDGLRKPALSDTVTSTGAAVHHAADFSGKGWTVAVLDSGVDRDHPSFTKAMRSEACFSSTIDSADGKSVSLCKDGKDRVFGKRAAINCDTGFTDHCIHGTHVAGIVLGRPVTLTDGRVIAGMAPEAGLIAAQVFSGFSGEFCGEQGGNCISAWDSDIIAALEWVYTKREKFRIAAINMSLGGGDFKEPCDAESPYTEIIQRLKDAGIATVIATGNDAIKDGVGSPSCVSAAVSVAATLKSGKLDESYSNVAKFVTIAAPGTEIISAIPGDQFMALQGTSMAAPHVAGAFAMMRQEFPDMSVNDTVKLLRKKGRVVKDSRTGTKLKRMDLARIEPGSGDPLASPASAAVDADDAVFEQDEKLQAYGSPDMRTVIIKSSLTAEELKAKLGASCKAAEGCEVAALGGGMYRVTVPLALVEELGQSKGAGGTLEKQLEGALGGGAKVFRNQRNAPLKMTPVKR
jgi:subtilisin family serine protease